MRGHFWSGCVRLFEKFVTRVEKYSTFRVSPRKNWKYRASRSVVFSGEMRNWWNWRLENSEPRPDPAPFFGIVSALQSVAIASRYDAPLHPLPALRHAHPHSRVRRRVCETAISHGIFISFFYAPTKINSVRGHRLPTMRNRRASRKNARYAYSRNKEYVSVSTSFLWGRRGGGSLARSFRLYVGTTTHFEREYTVRIMLKQWNVILNEVETDG